MSQRRLFSSSQMLLFHQSACNCASDASLDNAEGVGKLVAAVVVCCLIFIVYVVQDEPFHAWFLSVSHSLKITL